MWHTVCIMTNIVLFVEFMVLGIFFYCVGRFNYVGRGTPSSRVLLNNRVKRIPLSLIPSTSEAVQIIQKCQREHNRA